LAAIGADIPEWSFWSYSEMKLSVLNILAALGIAVALSGCIVVPARRPVYAPPPPPPGYYHPGY
jgi:hypothetical protein